MTRASRSAFLGMVAPAPGSLHPFFMMPALPIGRYESEISERQVRAPKKQSGDPGAYLVDHRAIRPSAPLAQADRPSGANCTA